MKTNYWNDEYWKKNLANHKNEKLDFLNDIWLYKYDETFKKVKIGKALDLGCGLGQYTAFLLDKGFETVSADISKDVLLKVKENHPATEIIQLDMSKPLPFADKQFDLVFANLSIHYFNTETTTKLLQEIKRILKDGGYFIGSVNSSKTYKFIEDVAVEIEPNYYQENGRTVRLWNKEQFDFFFQGFTIDVLEEVETFRWNLTKIMWEFIVHK